MKRPIATTLCALLLLGALPAAAKAPAGKAVAGHKKTPPKSKAPKELRPSDVEGFTAGPFKRFEKLLTGEQLVVIKQYYDSLAGKDKRSFLVLVRGVLRLAERIAAAMGKVGKSGLGIAELWRRGARNVLMALSTRKFKSGKGATRWTFARLRSLGDRLRAVLQAAGARGLGFVKVIVDAFERLKKRVRLIAGGKKKWVPGRAAKAIAGFRAALMSAFRKVLPKVKGGLAAARKAWGFYLEGFMGLLSKPNVKLFGRFQPEYERHEKVIRAWFAKFKGNVARAHKVIIRGLGALVSEGKIAGGQIGIGAMAAMMGMLYVLPEAVAGAAKKGLALGKGLEKFLIDTMKKWAPVWEKTLAAKRIPSPGFGPFITGAIVAQIQAVIARANLVLAGKKKLGPGKIVYWFKQTIDKLRDAFPKKFDAKAFERLATREAPPKVMMDFFATIGK